MTAVITPLKRTFIKQKASNYFQKMCSHVIFALFVHYFIEWFSFWKCFAIFK